MVEPILLLMLLAGVPPDCEMVRGQNACERGVHYMAFSDMAKCKRAVKKLKMVIPEIIVARCFDTRDGGLAPRGAAAGQGP